MDKLLANKNVLRIIALILSIILWFAVQTPDSHSTSAATSGLDKFPRPIHVQTAPGMVVTSIQPAVAVLEVKDNLLTTALSEQMINVEVVADAKKLTKGSHQITLQALNMPPVQYQLSPVKVTVTLAPKDNIRKPVRIVVQGQPKNGYTVGAPSSNVDSVVLSGAKKQLQLVSQVDAFIQLNGASTNLSEQVDLVPVDDHGQTIAGISVDPSTATVNVPIQSPENNATLNPVVVGTPAAGYAVAGISVSPTNVKIYGENASQTIQLPVDVNGLSSTQKQNIDVPVGANVNKVSPQKVSVTIQIQPSETKQLKKVPIEIRNTTAGQTVKLTGTKELTVQLTGPKSVMDSLSASDLNAYIDASQLSAKDTSAPVMISAPQWVQVTQLSVTTVPVTVTKG